MTRDKKDETRGKLVSRLIPYLQKTGLQSVKMDEIAKVMEISRATLYKYFSTKDEIIDFIIDGFIKYMNDLTVSVEDSEQSYGVRFQRIFEQSVSLVVYFNDSFLATLETGYPDGYERLHAAMQLRERKLLSFYEEGIHNGTFNDINGKLIIRQDEMLRGMLSVKYLMTNQMTVSEILSDYYQLKKIQLFKADKMSAVDDALMKPKIEHLTQKITKALF